MKIGTAFLLAGLLVLWALPASGTDIEADLSLRLSMSELIPVTSHAVAGDLEQAFPGRDPEGPHDIAYDDGESAWIFVGANLWARVRFTAEADFTLMAVHLMVRDWNNIDEDCDVFVYDENQDNHNLTDVRWETNIDDVADAQWMILELDEEDYIDFEEGTDFSIVWGIAPGGHPDQGGRGWWHLSDDGTDVDRSFLLQGNEPSQAHRDWNLLEHDLFCRANGKYTGEGVDLEVLSLENESDAWSTVVGTGRTFSAGMVNNGTDDSEGFLVSFWIEDNEGHTVWHTDVMGDELASNASIVVEAEELWEPDSAGHYTAYVEALPFEEDIFPQNNDMSWNQLVYSPEDDPDTWIGYHDGGSETQYYADNPIGHAAAFYNNSEGSLALTAFQAFIGEAQQNSSMNFEIFTYSPDQGNFELQWEGSIQVPEDGDVWLEMELNEDDYVSFFSGEAVLVSTIIQDGQGVNMMKADLTPPIAGARQDLDPTMFVIAQGGGNSVIVDDLDWMIDIKVGPSTAVPPGARLRIEPSPIDFGYGLAVGEDHVIEATFTAYGDEPVTIMDIAIAPSGEEFFTAEPTNFEIEAQGEVTVTITFRADSSLDIASAFLVINNSTNLDRQYRWNVHAATVLAVDENVRPGIPESCEMSQNYPNPFNPLTTVDFSLAAAGRATFQLFDMTGRMVKELFSGRLPAGYHQVEIDASDLPAGIYLYRLTAGEFTGTRKMILLK